MTRGGFARDLSRQPGSPADLEFYLRLALGAELPVLELGCGEGRVAIALAQAGVRTVGLDRDHASLSAATRRSAGLHAIDWVQAEMSRPPLSGPFGLILVPYRGFACLLDQRAQRATLAAARELLAPGGRLALDLFNPEVVELLGRALSARAGGRTRKRLVRSPDGPELRVVYRAEMEALLLEAGLQIEALYGGFDRSPFSGRGTDMVWVARRA